MTTSHLARVDERRREPGVNLAQELVHQARGAAAEGGGGGGSGGGGAAGVCGRRI